MFEVETDPRRFSYIQLVEHLREKTWLNNEYTSLVVYKSSKRKQALTTVFNYSSWKVYRNIYDMTVVISRKEHIFLQRHKWYGVWVAIRSFIKDQLL